MATADQLLQVVCFDVFRELERRGQQHSCIAGSAILLRVLTLLGFSKAYPLTVWVQIWNRAYTEWFNKYGDPEGDPEKVAACNDNGGIRVFVGKGPEDEVDEDKWPGHLAVVLPNAFGEKHALLDLSIVQANRPEWGVVLQPMCLKVSDDFVVGRKPFVGEFNNCMFAYKPFPNDHSYRDAPAWTVTEGLDAAAAVVVGKLQRRSV